MARKTIRFSVHNCGDQPSANPSCDCNYHVKKDEAARLVAKGSHIFDPAFPGVIWSLKPPASKSIPDWCKLYGSDRPLYTGLMWQECGLRK